MERIDFLCLLGSIVGVGLVTIFAIGVLTYFIYKQLLTYFTESKEKGTIPEGLAKEIEVRYNMQMVYQGERTPNIPPCQKYCDTPCACKTIQECTWDPENFPKPDKYKFIGDKAQPFVIGLVVAIIIKTIADYFL